MNFTINRFVDYTTNGRQIRGTFFMEEYVSFHGLHSTWRVDYDKGYELRKGEKLKSGYTYPPQETPDDKEGG